MAKAKLRCPHCNQPLSVSLFTSFLGTKGGAAGTGAAKRRTPEQYIAAGKARWAKHPPKPKASN